MSPPTVLNDLSAASQIIVIHEMGHGIASPDYYNWSVWSPNVAPPPILMNAGVSAVVTDWDHWMLRWTWSHIRSRF